MARNQLRIIIIIIIIISSKHKTVSYKVKRVWIILLSGAAVAASRLFVLFYIINVFSIFWTLSVPISVSVDASWCAVSDCIIVLSFLGRFFRDFAAECFVFLMGVLLAAAAMFSEACRHDG